MGDEVESAWNRGIAMGDSRASTARHVQEQRSDGARRELPLDGLRCNVHEVDIEIEFSKWPRNSRLRCGCDDDMVLVISPVRTSDETKRVALKDGIPANATDGFICRNVACANWEKEDIAYFIHEKAPFRAPLKSERIVQT